jgi:hypothetical protein
LDRRLVGLRVGLDDVEKRNLLPYRDSHSDSSVFQTVASRYTDCAIPAPEIFLKQPLFETLIDEMFI